MKDICEKMISRTNTMSRKWDSLEKHFGHTDVLPLWIADMDFQSPEPVREALAKLACDGVYGYTDPNEKIFNSIVSWFSRRHQWDISPASIHFTPGVLSGITFALEAFSKSGDGVVIQSPVYPPFAGIPNGMERKPLLNPLVEKEPGHYVMDLNGLEDIFQTAKPKWMILCNPHNPVGRVWTEEELKSLAILCAQYGVGVISDEIHGDVVFAGHKYIPFAKIAEPLGVTVLTGFAASKTFNLAGLTTSVWIVNDPKVREGFWKTFQTYKVNEANLFGIVALQTCFDHCEDWLDGLNDYLRQNAYYVNEMLNYHAPGITANFPEATFMTWLDCREMNLSQEELKSFFLTKAKVALNDGTSYGSDGRGFMRLNFGCPREQLRIGLERIVGAARNEKGWKAE